MRPFRNKRLAIPRQGETFARSSAHLRRASFFKGGGGVLRCAVEAIRKVRAVPAASTLRLRVGYAPSPTVEILPRALCSFQRAAPWVQVGLLDQSTEESLAGLPAGTIDVALVVQPPLKQGSGLVFEKIIDLSVGIIVPHNHAFARRAAAARAALRERLVLISAKVTRTTTTGFPASSSALESNYGSRPRWTERSA